MDPNVLHENSGQARSTEKKRYLNRRDILKGLATVPVLGVFLQKFIKKKSLDETRKNKVFSDLGINEDLTLDLPSSINK